MCHEARIVPRATFEDRAAPDRGHKSQVAPRLIVGWMLCLALFAALTARYVLRDPDSQLYETLSRSLETRPFAAWIAPVWPAGRAKGGVFVEHFACALWPGALLGKLGAPRGALLANFGWFLLATLLLFRLARALANAQIAWAAAFLWVASPLGIQALLRANHELPLAVAYLGALLCLSEDSLEDAPADPGNRPETLASRLLLPLCLVLAVAIKGGLGLLVFPATLAGWWVLSRRRARLWQIAGGAVLTALSCGLYEVAFRHATGQSFLVAYLWSQTQGVALEQREGLLRILTNPLYYAGNALWFALPSSLLCGLALLQRRTGPGPPQTSRPLRLALAVFAAGAGLLSLMARRAVRYSFPLIVLLALPGAVALCQNFPSVRRALERQQARLPWLLMAALLGVVAARVWFDGHAYRFVNLL